MPLNIERAELLYRQLSALPPERLRMDVEIVPGERECDTVACVAGWCSLLNGGPHSDGGEVLSGEVLSWAGEWLGISPEGDEYWDIFYGHSVRERGYPLSSITLDDALGELRRLIEEART